MKDLILDTPFQDGIQDLMTKDETILWEGQPVRSLSIFDIGLDFSFIIAFIKRVIFMAWFVLLVLVFYAIFGMSMIAGVVWSLAGIISVLAPEYFIYKRKISTKYILTSKQIVFHLWWRGKKSTHVIPLLDITGVMITEEAFGTGVILISVKNAHLLKFRTHDFGSNEQRHQPSLEMIENVKSVVGVLQQAILENRKR